MDGTRTEARTGDLGEAGWLPVPADVRNASAAILDAATGMPVEDALVEMWLANVWRRSNSSKTQEAYKRALSRYRAWLAGRPLRSVQLTDAVGYARHLEGTGLAASSQAQALAAVRSLYRFMARVGSANGGIDHSPFDAVPTPKVATAGAPRMLSTAEVRAMLEAASPKAAALVRLLATTGLRISEALAATWADVFTDPHGNTGLRVVGKGGKLRDVKLIPSVVDALGEWKTDAGPLLPVRHGGPMTKQAADAMLARLAKKAGIRKNVSAHWLRHFLATQALANGAPLLTVQRDLGHAALATTQRYLHAAEGLEKTSADFVAIG